MASILRLCALPNLLGLSQDHRQLITYMLADVDISVSLSQASGWLTPCLESFTTPDAEAAYEALMLDNYEQANVKIVRTCNPPTYSSAAPGRLQLSIKGVVSKSTLELLWAAVITLLKARS